MDRLIKPEPQLLHFMFLRGQKCQQTFKLTNLMHAMPVAISLTCSNPSLFSFPQPFSTIPPLSSASYTIQLTGTCDHRRHQPPPLSTPPDTILVRSSMLPTGKATAEHLRRLFSTPGPHIFRDAKIPIILVGPDVAEYLLSPSKKPLEVEFLFSKAISWCDRSQLTSLLRLGVRNGKTHLVSALIEAGADVNHWFDDDDDGARDESLLALAVRYGNPTVVETLIQSGCVIDDELDLVLHDAAAMGRVDLMEILRSGYADVDPNSKNSRGQTPLHVASIHARAEAIRFLVSTGCEADAADDGGYTPLHYSSERGDLESVEYLLNHSIVSKYALTRDERKTPFDLAIDGGNAHLFDVLRFGDSLLEAATKNDAREVSNCLDHYGAVKSIDCRDQNGWTPLHRAAFKGSYESAEILVGRGARVDVVDRTGYYTPLSLAIEAGHVEVAVFLLSHGAKLSAAKGCVKGGVGRRSFELKCFENRRSSSLVWFED